MSVGFDVANYVNPNGTQPFVDFTRAEAKELYIRIIEILQEPQWYMQQVIDAVYDVCARYRDKDIRDDDIRARAVRIARTELNRIMFYCREQMAVQDGQTDYLYRWDGPLDKRTTPMCRYMQTGELKGENKDGTSYDYEYLRPQLPEWNPRGMLLPDLKDACRQVHDVFYGAGIIKTQMITDWQMHINCRHSFYRTPYKVPKEDAPDVMDDWIQIDNIMAEEVPPFEEKPLEGIPRALQPTTEQEEDTDIMPIVELVGEAVSQVNGEDDVIIEMSDKAKYTFGFKRSFRRVPSFYLPYSDENDESAIFQFTRIDEYGLGKWLRFYVEELSAGLSEDVLNEILVEESGLKRQEIAYIRSNWDWLFDVAMEFGWIL